MKPLYRIILFILICWFGYTAIRQTFEAQERGVLDFFQYSNLYILILLSLAALVSDTVCYRSYKKLFQFYSSIAGLFLCAVIFFRLITFNKIDSSKTLLTVSTKADSENVLSMQFKENGYLRIEQIFRLGQNIYYGRYYRDKDTLAITQTNYESFAQKLPLKGVIDSNWIVWNNSDTMQIKKVYK